MLVGVTPATRGPSYTLIVREKSGKSWRREKPKERKTIADWKIEIMRRKKDCNT
jgi:hypothetical protein